MMYYWYNSNSIKNRIYIPKYYDPEIIQELDALKKSHHLYVIQSLVDSGVIETVTGHEIGKLVYGTGDIPFVRTSDISNWEIKTVPKQGVSDKVFVEYADSQDVKAGDILLVRDGTYLIGTSCIVTALDEKILYQSHILKFRILKKKLLDPHLLFLAFNTDIVQRQIRSIQFTADTIDTIGNRFLELTIPIPKNVKKKQRLSKQIQGLLEKRERGKAFIRHCPVLIEQTLFSNRLDAINNFMSEDWDEIISNLKQETVTSEFGHFETFRLSSQSVKERIYLPKYYDPEILKELRRLNATCECVSIGTLVEDKVLEYTTGDEIGKMAYGTGKIPFIRTSDFANWEIKHDPKQGVSEEIYLRYAESQDVRPLDILLVRDGTYLVGTSCIITENDARMLFSGGLYKIRVLNNEKLNAWLLLGLLNSYIVKRQIRTKQFTRDVIDTLGNRLQEIVLPIPKSSEVRYGITSIIKSVVKERIDARVKIKQLASDTVD